MPDPARLTPRQRRAVLALLSSPSASAAARAADIPERTLNRWRQLPAFQAAMQAEAKHCFSEASDQLRAAASEAVHVLVAALGSETESIQLKAAIAILDSAGKFDLADLAARVAALEQQQ